MEWWNSLPSVEAPLARVGAEQRVGFLRKATKLKRLLASKPIEADYSTLFWTVCAALRKPLDPINGFIIDEKDPKPWQERHYISAKAALQRIQHGEGLRVHPSEKQRLQALKKMAKEHAKG
jgi:hypothetical protein